MSFRVVLVGVALVALAGSGGCVDNDRSLTVTRFIPPTISAGSCVIDSGSAVSSSMGVWDLTLAAGSQNGYEVFFGIKNALMALSATTVEEQAYYINSFDVQLEPVGAVAAALPSARRDFNVAVGTQRLGPGDLAAETVEAIPPDLIDGLAASAASILGTIIVHVRPVATRAEEQVTGAYAGYPVQICKGCLIENLGACPVPIGTVVPGGNACNGAQDIPIGCCTSGAQFLCGAQVPFATAAP